MTRQILKKQPNTTFRNENIKSIIKNTIRGLCFQECHGPGNLTNLTTKKTKIIHF